MIPTAYLEIGQMPKTPNGKIDLKSLKGPKLLRLKEYEAPENRFEKAFCDIFSKVTGVENVSANDSFFDIGGSYLSVTRVIIESKEKKSTVKISLTEKK